MTMGDFCAGGKSSLSSDMQQETNHRLNPGQGGGRLEVFSINASDSDHLYFHSYVIQKLSEEEEGTQDGIQSTECQSADRQCVNERCVYYAAFDFALKSFFY